MHDAFSENLRIKQTLSMEELFIYFSDDMCDITWIQTFHMMLQTFRTLLADQLDISDGKINGLADAFMDAITALLKAKL